jgi:hypothetical protein
MMRHKSEWPGDDRRDGSVAAGTVPGGLCLCRADRTGARGSRRGPGRCETRSNGIGGNDSCRSTTGSCLPIAVPRRRNRGVPRPMFSPWLAVDSLRSGHKPGGALERSLCKWRGVLPRSAPGGPSRTEQPGHALCGPCPDLPSGWVSGRRSRSRKRPGARSAHAMDGGRSLPIRGAA